ncbi:MAG: DUF5343 domain-containing protein [Gemmatimonadetes bacterium]|nr:DUF5343 domain-containing protein [Gemmatimonadota bacterium]
MNKPVGETRRLLIHLYLSETESMQTDVPYLMAVGNLPKILDKIQNAGAPETFNLDFLKDLGFTSSHDRPTPKLLKYIGLLDSNGHPTASYKEFMDHTKARKVLATRSGRLLTTCSPQTRRPMRGAQSN